MKSREVARTENRQPRLAPVCSSATFVQAGLSNPSSLTKKRQQIVLAFSRSIRLLPHVP